MKNILPNLIIVSFLTIVLSCATDDAIPVAENTTTPNPTEDPTEDPQQQYDYMPVSYTHLTLPTICSV